MKNFLKITILCVGLVTLAAGCNQQNTKVETPLADPNPQNQNPEASEPNSEPRQIHKPVDFLAINKSFKFNGSIPAEWMVEYVPSTDAINIFDPFVQANTNLDKSQIFIRNFTANSFLTLTTVDILNRKETAFHGRAAVQYEIKKKVGVPDFSGQPFWRNNQHRLVDIRLETNNPSLFYVFSYNPNLDPKVFDRFILNLQFN